MSSAAERGDLVDCNCTGSNLKENGSTYQPQVNTGKGLRLIQKKETLTKQDLDLPRSTKTALKTESLSFMAAFDSEVQVRLDKTLHHLFLSRKCAGVPV